LSDEEGRLVLELEGILKVRTKPLHSKGINEYLIKWRILSEDEFT
jgi:hypothetical protein